MLDGPVLDQEMQKRDTQSSSIAYQNWVLHVSASCKHAIVMMDLCSVLHYRLNAVGIQLLIRVKPVCVCVYVCMHAQSCLTLLRPHGLQFARPLCSWNSPGKNTGVGCHFLLQGSSWPRDQIWLFCTFCTGRWILYHCATQEARVKQILSSSEWFLRFYVGRDVAQFKLVSWWQLPPVIDNIFVIMQSFLLQVIDCLDIARYGQHREGLASQVENSCVLYVFGQCLTHQFFHL